MARKLQEKVDTNPDMWGAREVSDFLKICNKTVYIMARKGEIPCTIIGNTFRFSRKKIESLV